MLDTKAIGNMTDVNDEEYVVDTPVTGPCLKDGVFVLSVLIRRALPYCRGLRHTQIVEAVDGLTKLHSHCSSSAQWAGLHCCTCFF